MSILVASLSTGKGTWLQVSRLIDVEKWDKVYLVTNEFGKQNYNKKDNVEYIIIDETKEMDELRDTIANELKGKVKDTEVGLNLVSGSGKEHMALLSAILKLGLGIRLIAITNKGSTVL